MPDRLAAVAVAVPFLLGTFAVGSAEEGGVAFRFEDPAIVESSGLVVQDGWFLTTNDSGDSGRVFAVDPASGRTVGVTRWAEDPVDVEALAPAGSGEVWVGDIGDNAAARPSVQVVRVPVGAGDREADPTTYSLTYPGGARDAETLLAHPVTGRLHVVSKSVFGGALYAAPARLDASAPQRMTRLGRVLPIATDGAFLPDGRHLVLRDYGRAVVYTFPGLHVVAEVDLPRQRQGEGLAVDDTGRVFVSSEGRRSPVLEVVLPTEVGTAPGDGSPAPDPTPPPGTQAREQVVRPQAPSERRPVWPWLLTGVAGAGAVVVLLLALRRR